MPATTRQTAGPGFTFEDLTAAWLISKLLVGQRLRGVDLAGAKIQSQTGSLGWNIDDLLVSTDNTPRHLALSCKSNVQVSANGLPSDFVERAWDQWRQGGGPMQKNTDCLGLVTRGRHPGFDPIWADVVNWARSSDVTLAISRIRETKKHSKVFDSIKSPNGSSVATDKETIELTRRLTVIPLDFQLENSSSEAEAISRCRMLIQNGSSQEAEDIWYDLIQIAEDTRVGSGTISVEEIWTKLGSTFSLKDRPNFEGSWDAIKAMSDDRLATLQCELPTGTVLSRSTVKDELTEALRQHRVPVVFGESGTGKSALVKSTLDERFPEVNQVWLGAEQASAVTKEVGRRQLGIAYRLSTVLLASQHNANVLILDSVDKLDSDALIRVNDLIGELHNSSGNEALENWRVLIVCQTEAWRDRVQNSIHHTPNSTVLVNKIEIDEVKQALRASGELRWLSFREDAVATLTNLKTLSWVMQASALFDESNQDQTTPTAFVDRIWEFWTEGKAAPQNLLIRLAEREAEFERSFAISELDAADADIFQRKSDYLPLRKNIRNRVEFEHDLAAEWARFQRLKEISHDVERWSLLAVNPLWTGALRLLGQFLLRQETSSSNEWVDAFLALEKLGATLAADILLDSLYLDPEATKFLFKRKEFLFRKNGKYLNRLLQRFLQIGTIPNVPQGISELDQDLTLYVEMQNRAPILGYWPPIAYFLHQHIDLVADLVSPTVAKVCDIWCTATPRELSDGSAMPWRREFAETALATARSLQVDKGKGTIYLGDGEKPIYKAAFSAT